MREILDGRSGETRTPREAALRCARQWGWPVLPGVGTRPDGRCECGRAECAAPGAHPLDPEALAATTDARMIRWWWTRRPEAPVVMPTAGRAPCAIGLPAAAGRRALADLGRLGVRVGPVIAGPGRYLLLVAPYELPELGELLCSVMEAALPASAEAGPTAGNTRTDRVPASVRFHGAGGYIALPPTPVRGGGLRWVRPPGAGDGAGPVWLPRAADLLGAVLAAGRTEPDPGSRLPR
ncbi:bifunctional DNA primase/polymerase [Streptomyces alkaliphilus]|uniref:bifunctional DNA primase/polymerase n=1 Tax=Streptomyces alkaliphilus TaxID=1472722 RepID=UPI0011800D80|nr:bifunctional DNA primase/polymerase [Streptomyces alkaliphilus]MQS07644.1 DNA primase [Streptomyces alkaliphilus]